MSAFVNKAKKLFTADMLALLVFDITTGIMVVAYEYWFVNFDTEHIVLVRVLYMSKFIGARICGRWTNMLRKYIAGNSRSLFQKALADTLAVSSYQAPLYILSALIAGMSWGDIRVALFIFGVNALLLGWVYGHVLDYMRRKIT